MTALERMIELGWKTRKSDTHPGEDILDFQGGHSMNVGDTTYHLEVFQNDIFMEKIEFFKDLYFIQHSRFSEEDVATMCTLMVDGIC